LVVLAGTASAQPAGDKAGAQALFDEGLALLDKGDVAAACPKFEASLRLDPAIGTTLNLARCYEQAGKTASAWALFVEVWEKSGRTGARAQFAKEHADALVSRLPRMNIKVAAPVDGLVVTRDGVAVDDSTFGVGIPVDPGPRVIEAKAPGYQTWSTTVEAKELDTAEVEVPTLTALPPQDLGLGDKTPVETPVAAPSSRKKIGLGVGAGGVALLGTGLVFGALARSTWNDALDHCDADNACDDTGIELGDSARTKATISTVLVGVGLGATAAGAILYLTAPKGSTTIAPAVGGDSAGVVVRGRF
jgi:hypothetical protein